MASNGIESLLDGTVGVGDAVLLEPLTEDAFLKNLLQRFQQNNIYTFIGNVVVSINPYKTLPIYDSEFIERYRGRSLYELPPHIFAVSNLAYTSMKHYGRDQCILITGESGSGKTEASKLVMRYVSAVSSRSSEVERIKQQLLQSNPVLEAFGNAKTNRNDNSSRFGKYMDIEFDFKGDPIGGVISNYLLEKSRVVRQASGERNFHIFYLLVSGASPATLKKLMLGDMSTEFNYMNSSESTRDDSESFRNVMNAFDVIGFSQKEVENVLLLVAAILKIGNVKFRSLSSANGMEKCVIINTSEVAEICQLLSVKSSVFTKALTVRKVVTRQDSVTCNLSANEASYNRDALCKELYDRLFSWLVTRINSSIRAVQSKHKQYRVMGVLDIYGFEVFEKNGFEQFMINYCNEKLQQIFVELTLKEEQEEYVREGIEWLHIDYFNNAVICQLIENPRAGILSMLDEECLRPGNVTDQTFLAKLESTCGKHPHFESRQGSKFLTDKTLPHDAFRVQHYAGKVTYLVENFIDKNNNTLFRNLSAAAFLSEHPLLGGVKGLFPEGDPSLSVLKRPPTISTQFRGSMNSLMKNLLLKNPNYIRCIKPNNLKRAAVFSSDLVRHQVRYLGLLENVRVRRAGYAYRQKYEECLTRYKMLSDSTWPSWYSVPREGVKKILLQTNTPVKEYEYGRTKLFIRNPRTLFALEKLRADKLHDIATIIQKTWKGFYLWKKFQVMKRAQITISKQVKMYQARRRYLKLKLATIVLQTYTRGWKARCLLRAHKLHKKRCISATVIAAYWRGYKTRVEYRKFFRANAGKVIVRMMEKLLVYKFLMGIANNMPSLSPIQRHWPQCKYRCLSQANSQLKTIFHRWRCMKYRKSLSPERAHQLTEKLQASTLFNGKKSLYQISLPKLFTGDHVDISVNEKWKKSAVVRDDPVALFADNGFKIHRANGKIVSCIVVLTNQSLMLVDDKYRIKNRFLISQIQKISFSPYQDGMMVVHTKPNADVKNKKHKGDLILNVSNSIELATKLSLLMKNHTGKELTCHIANRIDIHCKTNMQVNFSQQTDGSTDSPVVKKHKNTFLVTVPQ